jgi:hypothetical protein
MTHPRVGSDPPPRDPPITQSSPQVRSDVTHHDPLMTPSPATHSMTHPKSEWRLTQSHRQDSGPHPSEDHGDAMDSAYFG